MTFIIAEVGVNHMGNLDFAKHLVTKAKEAGADAVKFQLFDSELLQRPELKYLELTKDEILKIYNHCYTQDIEFMCTPFDVEALEFLEPLVERLKISSGCIGNVPLLEAARDSHLPLILSTGMSSIADVDFALSIVHEATLLHCTSTYPCPIGEVNLRAMDTLADVFGMPVGYSDHTEGIVVPVAAVARGATVIEKHLTLNRNSDGPDHKSSIEPESFRAMVEGIRLIEKALGDGVKKPQASEAPVMKVWKR